MKYVLLLLTFLFIRSLQAQEPEKSWMIGSPTTKDCVTSLVADNTGNTYSAGLIDEKGFIIKQDPLHQTIWSKTITFPTVISNNTAISFIDLLGDTLFGCGTIEQNSQVAGSFYFKMNAQTGTLYWCKHEITSEGYLSAMRYANGTYFLVGGTEINNSITQAKVLAVSAQTGNLIWETPLMKLTYTPAGNTNQTYISNATEMVNGKMFLTGFHTITLSTGVYPTMPILIGITELGTVFLQCRIPLPDIGFDTSFCGSRIEYDQDGNVVLTCFNNGPGGLSNDPNIVLLKLDPLGNILFSKEYEIESDGQMQIQAFNETTGSYVFCGPVHTDFYVGSYTLKLDKNGEFQKCIGIQKPDTFYGGGAPYNGSGNSNFINGIHYFPNNEMHLPSNDLNINNIILDEDLNLVHDCAEISELPVTITNLAISLQPMVLTQTPYTFVYQNGFILEDLNPYVSCDSTSLNLEQPSTCQTAVTAIVSGFQYPQFHWPDGTVTTSNTFVSPNTDTVIVRVLDIRCCELIDTIVPVLSSNLTVSLPADTSICLQPGQSFLLTPEITNPNAPVNYHWNNNSTTSTLSVTNSGTYWVEVSDGCLTRRDSIEIVVLPNPEINGIADTAVCEGTFPIVLTPSITTGSSVLWENGLTTISRTITGTGIYTIQLSNSCGTTDSTVIITQIDLPEVFLISAIDSCLQNGQTIDLVPIFSDVTTLNWSNGTNGSQLPVSQSGSYTIYGSNSCGTDSASCTVLIRSFPELNLPATLDTCFEIGIGFNYTAQGSAGAYSWDSGSQLATELITQEGMYTCTVTNECGAITDSMIVNRLAALDLYFPNDSVTICAQQISSNLLQIETNYQYELLSPWTNHPAGAILTGSGWYSIRAFNSCGELWDSIYVDLQNEQALFMPNSFTPNHDAVNDYLEINTLNITINTVQIFNRWGEIICDLTKTISETPIRLWDGNYAGLPSPDGMYLIQITYENCFGIPTQFTGHVNLIR